MRTFYLIKQPDGRIILAEAPPKPEEELVDVINGKNWLAVRGRLCIGGIELYVHRQGYGYYDE